MKSYPESKIREAVEAELYPKLLFSSTVVERIMERLEPKARPAFVGDKVTYPGSKCSTSIARTNTVDNDVIYLEGRGGTVFFCDTLTHLDGAPVSEVFAPMPARIHVSQLVQLEDLDADLYYARVYSDGRAGMASTGRTWLFSEPSSRDKVIGYMPTPEVVL